MRRFGLVVVNRSCFERTASCLCIVCSISKGKDLEGKIGEGRLTAEHKILRHL